MGDPGSGGGAGDPGSGGGGDPSSGGGIDDLCCGGGVGDTGSGLDGLALETQALHAGWEWKSSRVFVFFQIVGVYYLVNVCCLFSQRNNHYLT